MCGCKILFCNGENNILDYDFRTLFNLTGRTSMVNIDCAKQQCQSFNGKLAYISSKVLNDKAVLQLKDILPGHAYYIDLTLQGNGVLTWGDGVPYSRTITPDFAFQNEHSRRPYASVTRHHDTYHLYHETGRELGHAICLIPRCVATRTTTTRTITITTTTIITSKTSKTRATTAKTMESKLTITQQTFNTTIEVFIFKKKVFPVVLAIVAGVTLLFGLLCHACCRGKTDKVYLNYSQPHYSGSYKSGSSGHGYSIISNNKYG